MGFRVLRPGFDSQCARFYCKKIRRISLLCEGKLSVDEARWKENSEIFNELVDDSAFNSFREWVNLFIQKV